jgi:hypothetical protein
MGIEVGIELDPPADVWRYPVETVSNSESGFERIYQGSAVIALWAIELVAGEKSKFKLRIRIGESKGSRRCVAE